MDYVTLCQICRNPDCKKGSKVFKVSLNCFDDQTGELKIDPITRIHFSFQCPFCLHTCLLDFKTLCPPFCMLHLKQALKEKKQKVEQLVNQLTSLVFEE